MRKILLTSLFATTLLFSVLPVSAGEGERDILVDLNAYRATFSLAPLEKDATLCTLASTRVEEIKSDWSHGQFQPEIDKIPNMPGMFYENLAKNFAPEDVVHAWSLSRMGHKEAMLKPTMKFGCVIQSGEYYTFEGYIP
jgi:uncharacterized protein YkwD